MAVFENLTDRDLCQRLTSHIALSEKLALVENQTAQLNQSEADQLVDCLKTQADQRRLNGQTQQAFEIGQVITAIGEQHGWLTYQGLGRMVSGDARNRDYLYAEGWALLEEAGRLHRQAEHAGEPDAVFNWARTIIGKWLSAQNAEQIVQVRHESELAERIFLTSSDPTAALRLQTLHRNRAIWLYQAGESKRALVEFRKVLADVDQNQSPDLGLRAQILKHIADVYIELGESLPAIDFLSQAIALFRAVAHLAGEQEAYQTLALAESLRGNYRRALSLLNDITNSSESYSGARFYAIRAKIHCYLELNDFPSAEKEAQMMMNHGNLPSEDFRWRMCDFLAVAQAELGKLDAARHTIEEALTLAARQDMLNRYQGMTSRRHRAQIALRQRDYGRATEDAQIALEYFAETEEIFRTEAHLVLAEVARNTSHDWAAVDRHCRETVRIARKTGSMPQLYDAYLLLGHAALATQRPRQAKLHYFRAAHTIDQLQRDLTIAFRPGFLSDKGDALCSLVNLFLSQGQAEEAFNTLEHFRVQTFMGYLARNGTHRWAEDDLSRALRAELDDLRQTLVARMNSEEGKAPSEVTLRLQQRVHDLTRDLYTRSSTQPGVDPLKVRRGKEIRHHLPENATLVAYYDDGACVRAFVMQSSRPIRVYNCLDARSLNKLQVGLDRAIGFALQSLQLVSAVNECDALITLRDPQLNHPTMRRSFETVARHLYDALFRPFAELLEANQPVFIVPHRTTHFVPFHLLYNGSEYLGEKFPISILPTAGLLAEAAPDYGPGASIIYDDRQQRLRCSANDAETVSNLLHGSSTAADHIDLRPLLAKQSGQILHLIAHARFMTDSPEMSFIELGGRQIFLSDLLQTTLRFRLVTLTACETGRQHLAERAAYVAHGDDLVGVGRAFLYAGAQAVLASQWLLGDGLTLPVVVHFYEALQAGESGASALRIAQRWLRQEIPNLHPVFWGAFQLIGFF
jgi:tetratricopeptide (TPR) repeat protein